MLILSLPTEVIMEVFKSMGWRDILRAGQTCRKFFEIAQDRSIWIHLLRDDSPNLLYRPILEAPIGEYTTQDLKNMVLRNISSTLGWNSPRKPHERTTPDGDFPIGDAGKVLLEGGRWLLSFGRNLVNYNPDYDRAVLAYDLDSPRFAKTIIYKDTSPEHNMVLMDIFAQVDPSQSCLAFTAGLQFRNLNNPQTRRFDVLRIEQRGRGSEAKLVTSTINSLSCEDVSDMLGDYALIKYPAYFFPHPNIKILNWRTSSSTRHVTSTLDTEVAAVIQLLPENKILAIESSNKIAIYRIPEFRGTRPLEIFPADENLQQPIWTTWLPNQVQNHLTVMVSKPSYGPFVTRLALMQDDQIYGLVIPHDGRTPALHLLAIAPALTNLRTYNAVTICIDKIYSEPVAGLEASMLAFSWPEEADSLEQPMAWVPPILNFTPRQFAGHHQSAMSGDDLVDDISGRVVAGSQYNPEEMDEEEWFDIKCWSVVDFFHPQFLPPSPLS